MKNPEVGKLIFGHQNRDAIHIAIAPIIAQKDFEPGDHCDATGGTSGAYVGIVDPFLECKVYKGSRFWLFLYPNTVTSLRHEWTHPEFTSQPSTAESEQWLRDFCKHSDCPDYNTLIAAATGKRVEIVDGYGPAYRIDDDYLIFSGRDAHGDIPDEFWDHVENVTGTKIETRPKHFSCSC